jgi:hypothetical protein
LWTCPFLSPVPLVFVSCIFSFFVKCTNIERFWLLAELPFYHYLKFLFISGNFPCNENYSNSATSDFLFFKFLKFEVKINITWTFYSFLNVNLNGF